MRDPLKYSTITNTTRHRRHHLRPYPGDPRAAMTFDAYLQKASSSTYPTSTSPASHKHTHALAKARPSQWDSQSAHNPLNHIYTSLDPTPITLTEALGGQAGGENWRGGVKQICDIGAAFSNIYSFGSSVSLLTADELQKTAILSKGPDLSTAPSMKKPRGCEMNMEGEEKRKSGTEKACVL